MEDDPIGKALGITEYYKGVADKYIPRAPEEPPNSDEEEVRRNIKVLIKTANTAVQDLARIAESSQDHESYSALASLLRTAGGLNKMLVDIKNQTQKPPIEQSVTNQNIILTTAEFQKMLLEKK